MMYDTDVKLSDKYLRWYRSCDKVADVIVKALGMVKVDIPVIVRLDGTNAAEGNNFIESGLDFKVAISS